ncbi:pilus assembly protein PilZ [Methylobacterium sp. J-072]|uniref:PilZ domain-containing protein n=1 Tax=Methylobacterium sp. J-072 TaxID=2836651 RepID=UPI001FB97B24|nr:PilZ domain-containing protein [Methylobacterium sp. J-072]MCJ2092410.1 pilus assembly protein PilZ [Methylobacterium sp. J-072]
MTSQRHMVVLPALCWNIRRPDFYAVTADVTAEGIRLRSSARLAAGEDLTCSIRHIGQLEVRITEVSGQDFVVWVRGGRATLNGLARQFVTLARAQNFSLEPIRGHRRIVPAQKTAVITLESGVTFPGHVLNVSASGIALLVDQALELGETIWVGSRAARVARHFEHGIGAAFLEPLEPDAVHAAMTL